MAQNFLYMFEVVVDDLLVTRPNYCAPEEYPTCCEVSFRNSVFLSICDREFGHCVDPTAPKCGKCCLFSLDAPIADNDRLLIHIYKKKTSKCKFLVGCTDMPIKPLFDKVMESFNVENPKWQEVVARHLKTIPNPKEPNKHSEIIDNDCDEDTMGRREQLCPTSELTKRLLPIFNLKGCQTGNVVLIIRLVANGPAIVSSFPFSRVCSAGCGTKPPTCDPQPCPNPSCPPNPCGGNDILPNMGRCCGGNDANNFCASNGSSNGNCDKPCSSKNQGSYGNKAACGGSKKYNNYRKVCNSCPPLPDPCAPNVKKPVCQRYFACNADKGCPCEQVEDDCERNRQKPRVCESLKCNSCSRNNNNNNNNNNKRECSNRCDGGNGKSRKCGCDECIDECENESIEDEQLFDPCRADGAMPECDRIRPCFIEPTRPDPGPEAYDEFEACLNGSGLVIRVLKDTHHVEHINDNSARNFDDNDSGDSECDNQKDDGPTCPCDLNEILQRSEFARNHIKRRTGGYIINHPKLPKIRANIKYSGNDQCCPSTYHVPFSKLKQFCENQENTVDMYRRRKPNDKCLVRPPFKPDDTRHCCVQVNREEIKKALKDINFDTRKKGIEVCYRTCDETDSDVFLVKLGSKQKCRQKKNNIEIELKTPKQPIVLPVQKVTTDTQINEAELDAALSGVCKGKGKRKGKGKGKGKK